MNPKIFEKFSEIQTYWRWFLADRESRTAQNVSEPQDPGPFSLTTELANGSGIRMSAGASLAGLTGARPGGLKSNRGPYLEFLKWIGRLAVVGIAAVGAMLVFFGVRGVGPAWAAQLGHGVPGVFTATSTQQWQDCTQTCHNATNWYGTFTSRSWTRLRVPLSPDGAQITAIGQHEAALYESDGWAYAKGGGPDWLLTTLMVVGGATLLAFLAIRGLRALTRGKTRATL